MELIPFGVELRGVPVGSGVTEGRGVYAPKAGVSLGVEKENATWAAILFVWLGPFEGNRDGLGEGTGEDFWEVIAAFGFNRAAAGHAATCRLVVSPSLST